MKKTEKSRKVETKLSDQKLVKWRSEVTRPQGGSHAECVLMEGTMASLTRQSGSAQAERRGTSRLREQDGWQHRELYYVQNSMLYVVVHRKEEKDGVGMMSNASHYREK